MFLKELVILSKREWMGVRVSEWEQTNKYDYLRTIEHGHFFPERRKEKGQSTVVFNG